MSAEISPVRPPAAQSGGRRPLVQSLDRALAILDFLILSERDRSLADISRDIGLAKSTTHRLLHTLEMRGFVMHHPITGLYRAGVKTLRGIGRGPQVHAVLEALAASSGETANLGVLVGSEILYVDRADSPQALRWQLGVGARVPAHCSALGKAILAFSNAAMLAALIPDGDLEVRTRHTVTSREALRKELALTRGRGYAIDDEEFMEGVRCIAAPILGERGTATAAISIAGPAFRLTADEAERQASPLLAAARQVALLFGHDAAQPDAGAPR